VRADTVKAVSISPVFPLVSVTERVALLPWDFRGRENEKKLTHGFTVSSKIWFVKHTFNIIVYYTHCRFLISSITH